MRRLMILIAGLFVVGCGGTPKAAERASERPQPSERASSERAPAEQATSERAPSEHGPWEFPFELSAGKIFIPVLINGKGPYSFAMDTGSPPTVVDINLARELGLEVRAGGVIGGAGEGTSEAGVVSGVSLAFGGLTLPARSMPAADLNARLAPFSARPVMGLIGNDFISKRVVRVDYARQRITVWEAAGWEYAGGGVALPTRTRGYTFVNGRIRLGSEAPGKGEEFDARFLVDTGAGLAVSLNSPFVSAHDLLTRAGPKFRASVGWGLGGEVVHEVCRLDWIELGQEGAAVRMARPVAALSQDKAGALASRSFEALIGGDALRRYTVIFDSTRRRMILEPNADAAEPFEFDMSGIALGGNGGRGPLVALRVREGTPAAEAGVREGDEILSVDGKAVTGADRDRVKEMLREDGRERRLKVRRGKDEIEVRLKLRRMVTGESERGGAASKPA